MPLGIVYNPNIDPDMTIDQAVKEGYLTEAVVDNLCWDNLIKRNSPVRVLATVSDYEWGICPNIGKKRVSILVSNFRHLGPTEWMPGRIARLSKAMKKGEPVVKALRDLADEIERDYEFKKG